MRCRCRRFHICVYVSFCLCVYAYVHLCRFRGLPFVPFSKERVERSFLLLICTSALSSSFFFSWRVFSREKKNNNRLIASRNLLNPKVQIPSYIATKKKVCINQVSASEGRSAFRARLTSTHASRFATLLPNATLWVRSRRSSLATLLSYLFFGRRTRTPFVVS